MKVTQVANMPLVLVNMRRRLAAFLVAQLIFVCCFLPFSSVNAAIDWPEDQPITLYMPYVEQSQILDDLAEAWRHDTGLNIISQKLFPYELVEAFNNDPNGILMFAQQWPERREKMYFAPFVDINWVFKVRRGDPVVTRIEELGNRKIGIVPHGPNIRAFIEDRIPFEQIYIFDSTADLERALSMGTIDVALTNVDHFGLSTWQWLKSSSDIRLAQGLSEVVSLGNLAVHRDNAAMVAVLNSMLPIVRSLPEFQALQASIRFQQIDAATEDVLTNKKPLTVCLADGYAPQQFFNQSGKAKGILVNLLDHYLASHGLAASYLPVSTLEDQLTSVANRQCDISWGVRGAANNETMFETLPVLDETFIVIKPKGSDITDAIPRLSVNSVLRPLLVSNTLHDQYQVVFSGKPHEVLLAVDRGQADMAMIAMTNWLSNLDDFTSQGFVPADVPDIRMQSVWITHDPAIHHLLEIAVLREPPNFANEFLVRETMRYLQRVEVTVVPWLQIFIFGAVCALIIVALTIYGRVLKNAQMAQQTALRHTERSLANMSHELRNPMNSILGMSELMAADDELSPLAKEQAQIINRSGKHMLHLLNDVLDTSKIEAGEITIEHISVDVTQVLQDIDAQFKDLAFKKGLTFNCPRQCQLMNAHRLGDPTRLMQVISNLVSNAIKFTQQGFVAVDVIERNDGILHIVVEDSGIGIPADKLEQIFQRFKQVDDSMTRRFGGTGLGLSISRALAELMGGKLSVSSEAGKGTRFSLEIALPVDTERQLAPSLEVDVDEISKGNDHNHEQVQETDVVAMPRVSNGNVAILLVDDVKTNLFLLHMMLAKCLPAAEIDEAESVDEALHCLQQKKYQAVFTDINMPDKSGIDLLKTVRNQTIPGINPHISFVANSGDDDQGELGLMFNACMPKPISMDALKSVLQKINLDADKKAPASPYSLLASDKSMHQMKSFFMDIAAYNVDDDWQEKVLLPCISMFELHLDEMRRYLTHGDLVKIKKLALILNTLGSLLGEPSIKIISQRLLETLPLTTQLAIEAYMDYERCLKTLMLKHLGAAETAHRRACH